MATCGNLANACPVSYWGEVATKEGSSYEGISSLAWQATIVAALMVVFAVADFFIAWAQGAPILRVFAFIAAALVWLIGRALRALLT